MRKRRIWLYGLWRFRSVDSGLNGILDRGLRASGYIQWYWDRFVSVFWGRLGIWGVSGGQPVAELVMAFIFGGSTFMTFVAL